MNYSIAEMRRITDSPKRDPSESTFTPVEASSHTLALREDSGFVPGTAAMLIAADGTELPPFAISVNSFDQLTATLDLNGVPEGVYDVRVT